MSARTAPAHGASQDTLADMYRNGRYADLNPTVHEEDAAWKGGQVLRMIRQAGLDPRTICEVGCGSGGILQYLHSQLSSHVRFTGLEPMPEAYKICSAKTRDRMEFRNCTAAEVSEKFDLVLVLDVFEHVEDYLGFLRNIARLGDQFIFHIPLDMTAQMVLRDEPIMRVRQQVGHIHYFSKNTALATLQSTGYGVLDWFYTDTQGNSYVNMKTRLMKLPRRLMMSVAPDFGVRLLGGNPMMALAKPVPRLSPRR